MVALSSYIPHILFPLYFYPSPGAWQPLYNSIAKYPDVTFNVIINPNSGPGSTKYPDSSFIAGITQLNSYSNANLLGYVHTSYTNRAISDVESDIKQYSAWSSYTASNIKMKGIFFDEIPSDYTTDSHTYLQNIIKYANSLSLPTSILNPGTPPATQYYPLSTYTLVYEDYYSSFSPSVLSSIPSQYMARSMIMLHNFTGTASGLDSLVGELKGDGVGGVYVSTVEYDGFSALWGDFVGDVAS